MKPLLKIVLIVVTVTGLLFGQSFVGSSSCQACHSTKYADWVDSGHPYKFSVIENDQAPTYPAFVNNFQSTWMDSLGDGTLGWSNIAGVIGGFGWKARFVGTDGHLIGTGGSTLPGAQGGHNQFNFRGGEAHGWVNYHPADTKIYNYSCFKCHTTGGDTTGTWLTGVDGLGTFTEGGVGCEGCHGPGSDHIAAPSAANIDRVYEFAHQDNSIGGLDINGTVQTPSATSDDVNFLCGTCHNRSYTSPINASGGFVKHHEQWDELVATRHYELNFDCTTCHDPHKRTIWDGDAITTTCETCHSTQVTTNNHPGTANCVDCHMPFAAKSGTTRGQSGYKGDVRSHLFAITVDNASMFTDDGSAVRDDDTRSASLSPAYSCLGCHNDDPSDSTPDMTLDQVVGIAAGMHATPVDDPAYVGSETCGACHTDKYGDWVDSGHPYKFSVIENDQAPTYPAFVTNFQDTWMDSLGDGTLGWSNIAGVIGGFGWKARFVGTDGHLIGTGGSTLPGAQGGHNQFNFRAGVAHGWVDYHPADTKIYNYSCFKCHTTGGDTTGTWLTGVDGLGTFTEGGVGCEGCHGPGSNHAQTGGNTDFIDRVYEYAHLDNTIGGLDIDGTVQTPDANSDDINFLCGTCHNRSYTSPINSSGGFIKHHEQWDELVATRHNEIGFDCTTCHDPHKRTIWDGEGISQTCTATCHATQAATMNHSSSATCIDCHMPFAAKSGTTRGASGFKGDVRSHLFAITVDTSSMFTDDGSAIRDDGTRSASLSPAYSCLGCHNDDPADGAPDKTLLAAVADAAGMHSTSAVDPAAEIPTEFALHQNYPNPFNPSTRIVFDLPDNIEVNVAIFDVQGKIVYEIANDFMQAGKHTAVWNGRSSDGKILPSGIYFTRMSTPDKSQTIKMLLTK